MIIDIITILKAIGITTYALVMTTFLVGLTKYKFRFHKRLAILTVIVASIHGLLAIIFL